MHPRVDASPLQAIPPAAEVVFDTIYNPVETRLVTLARQARCQVVTGVDMFVEQGARQFELWFHQPPPRPAMRDALLTGLNASPD
jgi:shikimate 5-dehydrogenase